MSSPPPTKPPRGVKQGKETSGLLMSVIRTLSASETNEQREKERAKLEKEYKKSDARLDELVAEHAQEITDVMQKFQAVSVCMAAWGSQCEAAAGRARACRGLLRVRRRDLRRLWADARAHHHALALLTHIANVSESAKIVRSLATSGRVLKAAHTLTGALKTAQTDLGNINAIQTTSTHLQDMKKELLDIIVRRVSDAVYRSEDAPLSRRISSRRRTAMLLAELTKSAEVTETHLQEITPEYEASLTEDDQTFDSTVMMSLEALGVLDQLKEATEKFKCQIQNELLEVIETVSRRIIEEGDVDDECEEDGDILESDGVTETGRPLARLVASLGEEFRAIGARNRRLLQLWRAALQKHRYSETYLHNELHYWSAVQQVLQLLLTEYLEIESVTLAAARSTSTIHTTQTQLKLADYFAKKRPQRRRPKLFKLTVGAPPAPPPRCGRVCAPSPTHLYAVLPALHALCADIEPLTGGGECSLRAFISDYVRSGECERLATVARNKIEQLKYSDRERVTTSTRTGERGVVVLSPARAGWGALQEACRAAASCGGGAAPQELRARRSEPSQWRQAQSAIVPPCRASRWLADDDIVRFLQALPNWRAVAEHQTVNAQELKQAYDREAEILGSSLGDGAVSRSEIISEVNVLVDIAVLCESMDWLSANIKTIPSIVSAASGGSINKLSEKFLSDIEAAAMIFEEISHKCLLLLHLELRIECFHFVGQERASEESEAEGASQLTRALLAFNESAGNILHTSRRQYIVEGVGEMVSAAIVRRCSWGGGAAGSSAGGLGTPVGGLGTPAGGLGTPAGGLGSLGALRHALAALGLPPAALGHAQRYLDVIASDPEDIIASIRKKGPEFSELEYLNAFKIIGSRRGLSKADMSVHYKQLSAALGHVGVTV